MYSLGQLFWYSKPSFERVECHPSSEYTGLDFLRFLRGLDCNVYVSAALCCFLFCHRQPSSARRMSKDGKSGSLRSRRSSERLIVRPGGW